MKIGILGSGVVGQALARGLARHDHETRVGTRGDSKPELAEFVTGEPSDVAAWGDMLVLALHGVTDSLGERVQRAAPEATHAFKLLRAG
jgi:8-hydroxy-5-deazaflavin:NADPH oxidoreductase